MRRDLKRSVVAVAGVAAIALVAQQPTVDIRLLTHDRSDPAPRVMKAAVDVGLFGVSVLFTWTVDRLR